MNNVTSQKKLRPFLFIPAVPHPPSALKMGTGSGRYRLLFFFSFLTHISVILLSKGFPLQYVFKYIIFVPALTDVFVYCLTSCSLSIKRRTKTDIYISFFSIYLDV